MNKFLLLLLAAMAMATAHAQLSESRHFHATATNPQRLERSSAEQREAQMAMSAIPVRRAADNGVKVYYNRPAGAFSGVYITKDGQYEGMVRSPYLYVKPYTKYTYTGVAEGASGHESYYWDYLIWDNNENQYVPNAHNAKELTIEYSWEFIDVPQLTVLDGENVYTYQYGQYDNGTSGNVVQPEQSTSMVISSPTIDLAMQYVVEEEGLDLLMSSKTFLYKNQVLTAYYSGAQPFNGNEKGWWFGKNAGTTSGMSVNGIAQAFEKPTAPYLLKSVVMQVTNLQVSRPTKMTCKIYRLADGIPGYADEGCAVLDDEPGELIATGHAIVTPETYEADHGFITFTLYGEEDGLEFEITPTIDDAILVAIDGYNDPEMDNITDFTVLISADINKDEGYGELAYLRIGTRDENGNQYQWMGLNNFFGMEMKTGFTIFLTIDNPFLVFNYKNEDGHYHFPEEGGELIKYIGIYGSIPGIFFFSSRKSEDDGWDITCGQDEVPEWLHIELVDGEFDEFGGIVTALVTADPLPEYTRGRKAVVTFSIPGSKIDYTFTQYAYVDPVITNFDANGDGEVNIADVNFVIDCLLTNGICVDLNHDGEGNIADVNILIDYILGRSH